MSNELIRTMFKHLIKTYTVEEAKELLITKFPAATEFVKELSADDFKDEDRVQIAKVARVKAEKAVKEGKTKRTRTTTGPSKKDRAMELYKNSLDKSRKDMIELFVNELEMAPSSASNMYHTCKREYTND